MAQQTGSGVRTFTSRWCQCPGQEGYVTESDCPVCSQAEAQEPIVYPRDDSGKLPSTVTPALIVPKPVTLPVTTAQPTPSVNILPWLLLAGAVYFLTKD